MLALIVKPDGTPAFAEPAVRDDERSRKPTPLLCAACGIPITEDAYRIEVAGAHAHTFVNPGGFVHRLGCFALAMNVSFIGLTETAFSWFPGFTWQLTACMRCTTHLGWIYRCAGDSFHGLLLARLTSRDDDAR